jgi:chaperonin cofactor prefoldin
MYVPDRTISDKLELLMKRAEKLSRSMEDLMVNYAKLDKQINKTMKAYIDAIAIKEG